MKRHLIVKLSALGDIAVAAPAIQAFHKQEGGEVHWLVGQIGQPLVNLFPFVSKTYSVSDKRLLAGSLPQRLAELLRIWTQLGGQKFDTCIVMHADWRYRLPSLPIRAKRRVYVKFRKDRLTSFISGRSHSEELHRIICNLKEPITELLPRVDLTERLPAFTPFPREMNRLRVALVPGGAHNILRDNPQRRWPIENFVAVAKQMAAAGCEVALVGGPGEEQLAKRFSDIPVLNTIAQLSIPELLSFYSSCNLVISPDTGPLHLARLTRVPTIALYGPLNPDEFIPKGDGTTILWGGESLPCRPCYDGREFAVCSDNLCMKSISVGAVVRAANAILQGRASKLLPVLSNAMD